MIYDRGRAQVTLARYRIPDRGFDPLAERFESRPDRFFRVEGDSLDPDGLPPGGHPRRTTGPEPTHWQTR